jgi:hypothetical protein
MAMQAQVYCVDLAQINRINNERLYAGKKPVGFLNPTLYANSHVLNDITNGTNLGCGVNGFPAVPGWVSAFSSPADLFLSH